MRMTMGMTNGRVEFEGLARVEFEGLASSPFFYEPSLHFTSPQLSSVQLSSAQLAHPLPLALPHRFKIPQA
ncbi:hypothetical protein HZH66_001650 [Vespula vulgaris]|uniref:Uncharacterized protein n=1 Tax=Vespula vulgaris TaxID=7454 RepID=A0A834KI16_VESVU|nr:hypothetical protein HZH66_001650 [Vespula vulgaris]